MTRADRGGPDFIRPGVLPGILGAVIVVAAGLLLIGTDAYLFVRFAVSILAVILGIFAAQGRQWAWLLPLLAIAVLWNPVYPFEFDGTVWRIGHVAAGAAFVVSGVLIRVPVPRERDRRR